MINKCPIRTVYYVRRCYDVTVPIVIEQQTLNAVCDSGAEVSLCSVDVAQNWALKECPLRLVDAQKCKIKVCGECVVQITVGAVTVSHCFVFANIGSAVILGSDFLRKYECVLDFGSL